MIGVSLFVADSVAAVDDELTSSTTTTTAATNGNAAAPTLTSVRQSMTPAAASALEHVLHSFRVDEMLLIRVRNHFRAEMDAGLAGRPSSLAMLPSFVPRLPTGAECGRYLAVDLGGTSLRVLLLIASGGAGKPLVQQRTFRVPTAAKQTDARALFGFIADKIEQFCRQYDLADADIPLGFTFSYPMAQTSLRRARLLRWTKAFTTSGVVGEDPVALLEAALADRQVKVRVLAILNDTVGTQASAAFDRAGKCDLGVIVGTGTNAAYLETTNNITKLPIKADYPYDKMIIDTEWGAFGEGADFAYLLNEFDRQLDRASTHPKEYIFDKLVGGLYLGELVRLSLRRLIDHGVLLTGADIATADQLLTRPDSFPTAAITRVLRDDSAELVECARVLQQQQHDDCGGLASLTVSRVDRLIVRLVCEAVARRGAQLVGACLSALVARLGLSRVTVGIDGAVYAEQQPHYSQWLRDTLDTLLGHGVDVKLVPATDGSGRGAALVAAVAQHMQL